MNRGHRFCVSNRDSYVCLKTQRFVFYSQDKYVGLRLVERFPFTLSKSIKLVFWLRTPSFFEIINSVANCMTKVITIRKKIEL